jgi:hypothetical protein
LAVGLADGLASAAFAATVAVAFTAADLPATGLRAAALGATLAVAFSGFAAGVDFAADVELVLAAVAFGVALGLDAAAGPADAFGVALADAAAIGFAEVALAVALTGAFAAVGLIGFSAVGLADAFWVALAGALADSRVGVFNATIRILPAPARPVSLADG